MKLIFVNRYFYPDHCATAQLLSDLAFALVARGWEVHVVANRQSYDAIGGILPYEETTQGVRIHRVWTSRFGRARLPGRMADYLTFYVGAAWRLWRTASADDVIVAKTDPPMLCVLAACIASLRKARLVNWIQDLFPEVAQALKVPGVDGAVARGLRWLRDSSLNAASTNVVLGERMRQKLMKLGISPARTCTIPNWICGQAITPIPKERNRLRREWGLADKFVVGYSGNMGRAHAFDTIVKAASLLSGQADISFVWIGDGAQRQWLERAAEQLGLRNFVFKPYQPRERLCESLSVSDVHLIALRPELEGLIVPSKFYGIAAAGRPALFIGDVAGEIAMLLRRHQCGFSVTPGDGEALAKQIAVLQASSEMRRLMGARARRAFETNYDKRLALEKWNHVLRQVASRSLSGVTSTASDAAVASMPSTPWSNPRRLGIKARRVELGDSALRRHARSSK